MVDVGVIGGSGFYRFMDDTTEVIVETPYGTPSSPVSVGGLAGREVAFVARHGQDHEFPPHRINYRANLWALHSLGVRRLLAPCSVGSLQPRLRALLERAIPAIPAARSCACPPPVDLDTLT